MGREDRTACDPRVAGSLSLFAEGEVPTALQAFALGVDPADPDGVLAETEVVGGLPGDPGSGDTRFVGEVATIHEDLDSTHVQGRGVVDSHDWTAVGHHRVGGGEVGGRSGG